MEYLDPVWELFFDDLRWLGFVAGFLGAFGAGVFILDRPSDMPHRLMFLGLFFVALHLFIGPYLPVFPLVAGFIHPVTPAIYFGAFTGFFITGNASRMVFGPAWGLAGGAALVALWMAH